MYEYFCYQCYLTKHVMQMPLTCTGVGRHFNLCETYQNVSRLNNDFPFNVTSKATLLHRVYDFLISDARLRGSRARITDKALVYQRYHTGN